MEIGESLGETAKNYTKRQDCQQGFLSLSMYFPNGCILGSFNGKPLLLKYVHTPPQSEKEAVIMNLTPLFVGENDYNLKPDKNVKNSFCSLCKYFIIA
jgi:hypothetical protein